MERKSQPTNKRSQQKKNRDGLKINPIAKPNQNKQSNAQLPNPPKFLNGKLQKQNSFKLRESKLSIRPSSNSRKFILESKHSINPSQTDISSISMGIFDKKNLTQTQFNDVNPVSR